MKKGSLTIVGTGFLAVGQTTPEAVVCIKRADKLFHMVSDPVARYWLKELNPTAESLHGCYAEGKPRNVSYAEMAERMLAPVRQGQEVCAAFYGHPGVFVTPSHDAIRQARLEGHGARMLPESPRRIAWWPIWESILLSTGARATRPPISSHASSVSIPTAP